MVQRGEGGNRNGWQEQSGGAYRLPGSVSEPGSAMDRGDDPTQDLPIVPPSKPAPSLSQSKDSTEPINAVHPPVTYRVPAREPDGAPFVAKNSAAGPGAGHNTDKTTDIDPKSGNSDLSNELMGMGGGGGDGGGEPPFGNGESPNDEPGWFRRHKAGVITGGVILTALAIVVPAGAKALGIGFGSHDTANHKLLPEASDTPSAVPTSTTMNTSPKSHKPSASKTKNKSSSSSNPSKTSSPSSSASSTTATSQPTNKPTKPTHTSKPKTSPTSKPVVVPPTSTKPKISAQEQCVNKLPMDSRIDYTLVLGINTAKGVNDFSLFEKPQPAPSGGVTPDNIRINVDAAQRVAEEGLAGVIMMNPSGRQSEQQALKYLAKGNLDAKKVSTLNPLFMPMAIGTDQEGGNPSLDKDAVSRYKVPDSVIEGGYLPTAQQAAETLTPTQYQSVVEKDLSYLHKTDGINTVYAPVVDVAPSDGGAAYEGSSRIYSSDPATVIEYAKAYIKGAEAAGVNPVVKHFPGIGSATGNPDNGAAQDPTLEQLQNRDWKTFEALSKYTKQVMITTVTVAGKDGWKQPADLNIHGPATARQMGYDSITTDDIGPASGAIKSLKLSVGQTVVEALQAGNNKIMLSDIDIMNATEILKNIDSDVRQAIESGDLSKHTLDKAVLQNMKDQNLDACKVVKAYKQASNPGRNIDPGYTLPKASNPGRNIDPGYTLPKASNPGKVFKVPILK